MTEQNNQQFPNENDTATLNQMAADIRTLQSDMDFVKAELAKRTNPEFLSAFSQILKDVITDLKAEIKADLEQALANQEVKFDLALAQQKADFEQALANQEVKFEQALNNLRDEMAEEFKLVRREIRGIERRFHPITKDISNEAMRLDELEDRVEKLEAKLAS